jgi:hypothetical protein
VQRHWWVNMRFLSKKMVLKSVESKSALSKYYLESPFIFPQV